MRVKIAKDITKYKNKFLLGLTVRQFASLFVSSAVNIPIYIFLKKYVGESIAGYVAIGISIPILLFGWYETQGMTFEKYLFARLWNIITPPVRPYTIEKTNEKSKKNKKKKFTIKKLKKITIPIKYKRIIPFSNLYENGFIKVTDDYYSIILKLNRQDNKYKNFNIFNKLIYSINRNIHFQEIIGSNDESYIALGYKIKENDNPEEILLDASKLITQELKNYDVSCDMLNAMKILETFYNMFHPFRDKEEMFLLPKDVYSKGKKIRKYLAPSNLVFKESYIEVGNAYTNIYFLRIFPDLLKDNFINELLSTSNNIIISKHIDYLDKNETVSNAKEKILNLENKKQEYQKNRSAYITFGELNSLEDTKKMLESLQNNSDMFDVAIYISVSAETTKLLNEIDNKINSICRNYEASIDIVTHKQDRALASILPLANDKVGVKRKLIYSTTCVNYDTELKEKKDIEVNEKKSKFNIKKKNKDNKKLKLKVENKSEKNNLKIGKYSLKNLNSIKFPKTAQETLHFEDLYENGLIKVTDDYYAIILRFSNINYVLAREDEQAYKFRLYSDVLNSIDPEIHYQEILINESIDENSYRDCLIPKKDNEKETLISQDYVKVQESFIQESYNATSDKKTYIALGYRVNSQGKNPYNILRKAYRDTSLALKKLDSPCEMLKPIEVLEVFHNYLNPKKSREEKFCIPSNFYSRGVSIKDYISPSSFKFRNTLIEMGKSYTRIFYIKNYAENLEDTFIADLMDNSYNIVVTKHVDHADKGDALTFLRNKNIALEQQRQERKKKNKREGMDYIPLELQDAIDETKELVKSLQNDQDMFSISLYISVTSESIDSLDDICKTINTTCRKHMVAIDNVTYRQEQALVGILPLAMDKVTIERKMTTSAAAVLIPFNAQNVFQRGGFYYGRNSYTSSMVIMDRKKLKNGNGFVLGVPGSGKSFKEKREIIDVLELTDDDVIIIDPEREFGSLCEKYNGELIKVSANTNTHMNPFDISQDYADDDDPIQTKSDFILSIVETLKGSNLTPVEKTIVDRCVKLTYKKFIESGWNQEYIPTFTEFYEIVKEQPEPQAKDIALVIELYVIGSLNTFSHKSNVTLKNRLTVIDTRDLGKQLKKLGLLVVLDAVWNILCANKEKGKNTWIITDEFYLYFDDRDGKDSYSADYYYTIYKRSRKYGGMVTGITQNVEDLLQSPKARTMLSNSQFIILLDQAPTDRAVLKKLLNLSDVQENFITNAEKGCGLMVCGKNIIPIEDEYPKDNEVYKTITTNLQEIREYKLKEEQKGA